MRSSNRRTHERHGMFAEAVGMIAIAALSLTVLSASAGSRGKPGKAAHDDLIRPQIDSAQISAGGGYTLDSRVGSALGGNQPQTSAAGRWRMQGSVLAAETTGRDDAGRPDVTLDGRVGLDDLITVLQQWGRCAAAEHPAMIACPADINCDGMVDGCDLAQVIGGWRD